MYKPFFLDQWVAEKFTKQKFSEVVLANQLTLHEGYDLDKTKSKVFSLEKLYPLSQVPIP